MKLVAHEKKKKDSRDDYETPTKLFKRLNNIYNFDLDVCADIKNHKCGAWFGIKENGLEREWSAYGDIAWCNPPYSNWPAWMKKSVNETANGVTTVFLIPPRTGTKAWFEYVPYASEVIFLKGRVSFLLDKVPQTRNGADSCLIIFRPTLKFMAIPGPIMSFWDWKSAIL